MTTTIDIPGEILERVMRMSGTKSPADAVLKAIEEYTQRHDQSKLVDLLGTSDGFMTPEELDQIREMD